MKIRTFVIAFALIILALNEIENGTGSLFQILMAVYIGLFIILNRKNLKDLI